MGNKVLVVSSTETFTLKGIEMKLQGIGTDPLYAEFNVKDLSEKMEGTDIVVMYTDSDIVDKGEALVYIKDWCQGNDKPIIFIGTKIEYEAAQKIIPQGMFFEFFERPLMMEKFLDKVELCLIQEEKQGKRKNVLIVDDDVQYMSMISGWLKDKYRVSMANSGMNAITWLSKNQADLILLDYEMPVVEGPQVLEMFRMDPELAKIPVMFLTGNSNRDSIVKVVSLGPVDYLLKTIDRKGLIKKLDDFFEKQEQK